MSELAIPMDRLLAIALSAARDAAAFVHTGYRNNPRAEHKGRVDLVTEFDCESERLLRARLMSETPFPFVGEEAGFEEGTGHGAAHGAAQTATWFVDPIAGTTTFVHGHPFYCVP